MSTILDSLKKSSEQRDGNGKTSIDNFNFGNGKKSSKSGFIAIIIIFIIAIATLYYGYDYIFTDDQPIDTKASVVDDSVKQEQPQTKSTASNQPVINKKQKPDNKSVREKLKNIQTNNITSNLTNKETTKQDQSKIDSPKPKQSLSDLVTSISESNKIQNTEAEPTIKLSEPDKDPALQATQTQTVKTQKYPYVYQLPFSIRKDIPKFTLNIHVYDELPENRIVIINGVRFNIDDLIEEEILVKDILQEGVLLEFNGQVFLIPKL